MRLEDKPIASGFITSRCRSRINLIASFTGMRRWPPAVLDTRRRPSSAHLLRDDSLAPIAWASCLGEISVLILKVMCSQPLIGQYVQRRGSQPNIWSIWMILARWILIFHKVITMIAINVNVLNVFIIPGLLHGRFGKWRQRGTHPFGWRRDALGVNHVVLFLGLLLRRLHTGFPMTYDTIARRKCIWG